FEGLAGGFEFDLGHDQAGVVTEKLVDFPQMVAVAHQVAVLLHQATDAQREQLAGFAHGQRVFELLPGVAELPRLDVEECSIALEPHAHRSALPPFVHRRLVVEVTLGHGYHRVSRIAPTLTGHHEFPFDLDAHEPSQPSVGAAIAATCLCRSSYRCDRGQTAYRGYSRSHR